MISNYPSEAILQALSDLRTCESDERYAIDMYIWKHQEEDTCYVCQAGAILACRWPDVNSPGVLMGEDTYETFEENKLLANQIASFDDLRQGDFYEFIVNWVDKPRLITALYSKSNLPNIYYPYEVSPSQYKRWLRGVAAFLAKNRY